MVIVESGPSGRRFRLLETMRQFAAEQLREHGQADLVAERHARWCLREVNDIRDLLRGPARSRASPGSASCGRISVPPSPGPARPDDPRLADALVRPVTTELTLRASRRSATGPSSILAMTSAEAMRTWSPSGWSGSPNGTRRTATLRGYDGVVQALRRTRPPAEPVRASLRVRRRRGAARCLPAAVADLRRQGEEYLAVFLEMTSAGTLLGIGRFDEVDASVSALADRYRAQGPPTLLHWALQTLGYSASFQGRLDEAERYFDEAAGVDLPEGALSANKAIEARSAFRRGDTRAAFQLLRSYIDELFETDNVVAASVVCIEFINMMAAIDRSPKRRTCSATWGQSTTSAPWPPGPWSPRRPPASPRHGRRGPTPPDRPGRGISDREALTYMRDVLSRLAP